MMNSRLFLQPDRIIMHLMRCSQPLSAQDEAAEMAILLAMTAHQHECGSLGYAQHILRQLSSKGTHLLSQTGAKFLGEVFQP